MSSVTIQWLGSQTSWVQSCSGQFLTSSMPYFLSTAVRIMAVTTLQAGLDRDHHIPDTYFVLAAPVTVTQNAVEIYFLGIISRERLITKGLILVSVFSELMLSQTQCYILKSLTGEPGCQIPVSSKIKRRCQNERNHVGIMIRGPVISVLVG